MTTQINNITSTSIRKVVNTTHVHHHYDEGYTIVDNALIRNKTLKMAEKLMLIFLLSLPPDWRHSIRGYAAVLPDGETAIRNRLTALEEAGYIVRTQLRDDRGQIIGTHTDIYECLSDRPDAPTPLTENPRVGNPHVDNPRAGKRKQITKEGISQNQKNTHAKNTNPAPVHLSVCLDACDETDGRIVMEDEKRSYDEIYAAVGDQIDAEQLCRVYCNAPLVRTIMATIAETLTAPPPNLCVDGREIPGALVLDRYASLTHEDVDAMMSHLNALDIAINSKNPMLPDGTPIKNPSAYLRACLYNAPLIPHHKTRQL